MKYVSLILCLLSVSCASSYVLRDFRLQYEIKKFDDLLVSNLPIARNYGEFYDTDQRVTKIKYEVLIQNKSKNLEYEFEPQGRIELTNYKAPGECLIDKSRYKVHRLLQPNRRMIYSCTFRFPRGGVPDLKNGDQIGQFKVAYKSKSKKGQIEFPVKLRKEDVYE